MKLIDADELQARINRMWEERQLTNTKHKTFTELLTLDPEAIVRCKDCKHSSGVYGCRLEMWDNDDGQRLYSDDFCSYGEKE